MTDGVELEFVVERTPTAASKVAAGGASAAQQQQRELTRSVLPLEHGEEDYIADEQDEDEDDDEEPQFEDDTDSFMLREREFCFPGIPPGASDGTTCGVHTDRFDASCPQGRQLSVRTLTIVRDIIP